MIMILSIAFIIFIIYDMFFLVLQVPGWASLATIVSFFGSFNLFFCCLLAFFSTKLGNILSVKPNYILDK